MRDANWRSSNKGIPCEFGCPKGHRLYIEVHHPENKTSGGIILTEEVTRKEGHASMFATVLSIGFGCWADKDDDWCDVGDKILIGRHVGSRLQEAIDIGYAKPNTLIGNRDIRCIADLDVLGTVE